MKLHVLTAAVMLIGISGAAFAQGTSSVPGYPDVKVIPVDKTTADTTTAAAQSDGAKVQQQLSARLQSAGFTDVKIVPEAFLIDARNKSGEAVRMYLSPDSLAVFTAQDPNGQSAQRPADGSPAATPPK